MRIGIVLPSRGRPAGLKRMAASLMDLASKPDRVRIFAGLDDDDPTLDEIGDLPGVEKVIRPAASTCAKMIDALSLYAEAECDAVLRMDDDFVCVTRGWDDESEQLTGLGFWRIEDDTHADGFMSFAAMSSEMAGWLRQVQGFVHAPWFPFWFTDTWLSEIGDMSGLKAPLGVRVEQPEGRGVTHGMRDIRFWAEFFECYRISRARVARLLIDAAYPEGVLRKSAHYALPHRFVACEANVAHLREQKFVTKFEARAESFEGTANRRYMSAKAHAEAVIAEARA